LRNRAKPLIGLLARRAS